MENEEIRLYPTDEVLDKIKREGEVLSVTFGRVSDSGVINSLITRLIRVEVENSIIKAKVKK